MWQGQTRGPEALIGSLINSIKAPLIALANWWQAHCFPGGKSTHQPHLALSVDSIPSQPHSDVWLHSLASRVVEKFPRHHCLLLLQRPHLLFLLEGYLHFSCANSSHHNSTTVLISGIYCNKHYWFNYARTSGDNDICWRECSFQYSTNRFELINTASGRAGSSIPREHILSVPSHRCMVTETYLAYKATHLRSQYPLKIWYNNVWVN